MTPADNVNLRNALQTLLNKYGSNEVTHALEYLHGEDEDETPAPLQGVCKDCNSGTLNNDLNPAFDVDFDEGLYGATWIGDTVPTTGILVGQNWITPDGVGSYAAGTNSYWNGTSWVYAGNVNNLNLGSVERGGDTVTGPILNIPNVLPTNNANATGTFTVNGFPVALQTDLSNLQMYLTELITTQVRQQFLSQYQQSGTASDIAFYSTTGAYTASQLSTGVAIPLPTFSSDGTTATANQLLGYGWEVLTVVCGSSTVQIVNETSPGSRIITTAGSSSNWEPLNLLIRIWAFAVR